MFYHIIKSNRLYEGRGYSGPTCAVSGIEPGKTYNNIDDAIKDAVKLSNFNPIGFTVIETRLLQNEDGLEYYAAVLAVKHVIPEL